MKIIINGNESDIDKGYTVAQLIEKLQIPLAGTAVACNDRVVRKAMYEQTVLQAGDRVEIIRAVAGG